MANQDNAENSTHYLVKGKHVNKADNKNVIGL